MALQVCLKIAVLAILVQVMAIQQTNGEERQECFYKLMKIKPRSPKSTENDTSSENSELDYFGLNEYDVKLVCLTAIERAADENEHKRVRRGWGSRTSSSRSSSRSWGGSRSSSRSSSRSWGGSRSSSRTSTSRAWGSRRRTTSLVRTSARKTGWFSRRRTVPTIKKTKTKVWDKVHTALDVAGLVPGVGNVADVVNAGLHAARGNWKDAALSIAGAVPGLGQAATAAKIAKKSKNLKQFVSKTKITRSFTKKGGKIETIRDSPESFGTAKKIFQKETGLKPKDSGVTYGKTLDGKSTLTVRSESKTGPATLDVKDSKGNIDKIRCTGCDRK